MDKATLVKCFRLIGYGVSKEEQQMELEEERKAAALAAARANAAGLDSMHDRQQHHVHSDNYEVDANDETDLTRKEDKLLMDKIHQVQNCLLF